MLSGLMQLIRLARRFVVVSALSLWLGGFTVYTALVIRIGHRQLSAGKFGFVTGEVTSILNILAAIALLALLADLAAEWKGSSRLWRWGAAGTWAAALAATAALFLLHAQ